MRTARNGAWIVVSFPWSATWPNVTHLRQLREGGHLHRDALVPDALTLSIKCTSLSARPASVPPCTEKIATGKLIARRNKTRDSVW